MTVIYNMSIDRADKPWIGDRRLTESSADLRIQDQEPGGVLPRLSPPPHTHRPQGQRDVRSVTYEA